MTEKGDSSYPHSLQIQLAQVVKRSLQTVSAELVKKNITVVNQISTGLPPLTVDGESFQRLFDLLLKNEAISLPIGSHLYLSARAGSGEQQELQIEIRDDGPGLRREALRSVFDPFSFRAEQYPELGINLMACYFIVYHHGGRIDIRSEEGEGIIFTITCPLRPKPVSAGEQEDAFIAKVLRNDALWERIISGY